MKKQLFLILLFLLTCSCFICYFTGCKNAENIEYVRTRADFCTSISSEKTIYVDDIDFGKEEESFVVRIEKSVTIIGKPEKSTFKNAYLFIAGGSLESEKITVKFENVLFDGNYNIDGINIDEEKSFTNNFGSKRDEKRCITTSGFLSVEINNCDFTKYCTNSGPALYFDYTDGNNDMYKRMNCTLSNCKVYNNFCFKGAVYFNCKKPISASITNCDFYNNTAFCAAGVYVGGVITDISGCNFRNNNYQEFSGSSVYSTDYVTKEKKHDGAGLGLFAVDSELSLKNCLFENNSGYRGGALTVRDSTSVIESCNFLHNTASHGGGAIVVDTQETTPVYITNSLFIGNASEYGSALYCRLYDHIYRRYKAGKVELSLCSFAENIGELLYSDTKTYMYKEGMPWRNEEVSPYEYNIQKDNNGNLLFRDDGIEPEILGCVVIGDFVAKNGSYTYAADKAKAISDGVIKNVDFTQTRKIEVAKHSSADIILPYEVVKTYANGMYGNADKEYKIGAYTPIEEVFPIWGTMLITIGSLLALFATTLLIVRIKRKKAEVICAEPASEAEQNKGICALEEAPISINISALIKENVFMIKQAYKLSEREFEVTELLIEGNTAKQIAEKLFIGFNTVRFHCKNVYRKLDVHSQTELVKFCQDYKTK